MYRFAKLLGCELLVRVSYYYSNSRVFAHVERAAKAHS